MQKKNNTWTCLIFHFCVFHSTDRVHCTVHNFRYDYFIWYMLFWWLLNFTWNSIISQQSMANENMYIWMLLACVVHTCALYSLFALRCNGQWVNRTDYLENREPRPCAVVYVDVRHTNFSMHKNRSIPEFEVGSSFHKTKSWDIECESERLMQTNGWVDVLQPNGLVGIGVFSLVFAWRDAKLNWMSFIIIASN